MLIVGTSKGKPFSSKGDSGACIFNLLGNVVGILTGSHSGEPDDEKRGWGGVHQEEPSNSRKLKADSNEADKTTSSSVAT